MGYTHYWHQKRNFNTDEWITLSADLGELCKYAQHVRDVPLADGEGKPGTGPVFAAGHIVFNGVGDDGHETFVVNRVRPKKERWQQFAGSDFCKTAEKPYDIVVTACLCYLATVIEGAFSVTSDGKGKDFLAGLALAREALPRYANMLDIPIDIMRNDRWCSPWPNNGGSTYTFRFCVDGHAYIIRKGEAKAYRFDDHVEAARFAEACRDPTGDAPTAWNNYRGGEKGLRSVFDPTGLFDEKRHKTIAREQTRVLGAKFNHGMLWHPERMVEPPSYIRPLEKLAIPEKQPYYFMDFLKEETA